MGALWSPAASMDTIRPPALITLTTRLRPFQHQLALRAATTTLTKEITVTHAAMKLILSEEPPR